MKTKIETITPAMAAKMIERHLTPFVDANKHSQRSLSDRTVDGYARSMRAGQWGLTHQGIAIDSDGLLIDGQHRLHAIARSGVPVQMMVTTEIPANGSGSMEGVLAIDMIDRGKVRGVGQQLQMRHGVKDANVVAAVCRGIIGMACDAVKVTALPNDVGQSLRVLDLYGKEITLATSMRPDITGLRSSYISAAIAFAMKTGDISRLSDFAQRFKTGEMLAKGDPALTLRNYMLSNYKTMNGGGRAEKLLTRSTLTAAMHADQQTELKQIKISEVGYTYFMEKQRRTIVKLLGLCGYSV